MEGTELISRSVRQSTGTEPRIYRLDGEYTVACEHGTRQDADFRSESVAFARHAEIWCEKCATNRLDASPSTSFSG
jgi:hypothetical protein